MKRVLIYKTLVPLLLFGIFLIRPAYSQSISILEQLNISESNLNALQLERYNKLQMHNIYSEIYFVQTNNPEQTQNGGQLLLSLPFLDCPSIIFKAENVDKQDANNWEWHGVVLKRNGYYLWFWGNDHYEKRRSFNWAYLY
jgi:hypothetical protein